MEKDKRYNTVKILIEGGHIKEFREIFEHIPKTAVASNMGIHFNRFNRIIEKVEQLTLNELFILSGFIGIDSKVLFELAYNQHNNNKSGKKKKS